MTKIIKKKNACEHATYSNSRDASGTNSVIY